MQECAAECWYLHKQITSTDTSMHALKTLMSVWEDKDAHTTTTVHVLCLKMQGITLSERYQLVPCSYKQAQSKQVYLDG